MSLKWRIYCRDPSHEGFQTVWSDEEPTVCPIDEEHEVNPNSMSVVAREVLSQTITPTNPRLRSLYYMRAATLFLDSRDNPIRKITVFVSVDEGAGGYGVELYNHTTHTSLSEVSETNTTLQEIVLPTIELNEGINLIDVNVKYTAGADPSRRYFVHLDKICIYREDN